MEILILILLILLNGAFALSEMALITARKSRLGKLAEAGDRAAARALRLSEHPNRFLSTIQIGITSIGVMNGIVGESALADPLAAYFATLAFSAKSSAALATLVAVAVITYFSIVVGELVPKRLGHAHPEAIARWVALPMQGLATLSKPFVYFLSGSTDLLTRSIGASSGSQAVTEEDIEAVLAEGSESGAIEHDEHALVRNVFRLDERQLSSLMTPRSSVIYLDTEDSHEDNLHKLALADHSRFPVCAGGLDRVLGIANAKRMLAQGLRGETTDFSQQLEPAVFVPETLTGLELLTNFRASNIQMALVIDEYGEVQGLVTLQDVLEAITGEFQPRTAEDAWAVQREDGSWLLDGLIPLPELKDRLGLKTFPEEDKGRYHTLSGMIMMLLGRVPQTSDRVDWEDWRYEIVDMDNRRIDKVLATALPREAAETGAGIGNGASA